MINSLYSIQASDILRRVPFENGFHFTENGYYYGMTSTSLNEFERHLQLVSKKSIEFHFRRRDFQKWIKNTLCDIELSQNLDLVSSRLSGEGLRSEILKIVRKRILALNDELFGTTW